MKELLEILPVVNRLEQQLKDQPTNLSFMADTTWLIRKTKQVTDQIEKALNKLEFKVAEQACIVFGAIGAKNHSTDYCTVSPNAEFYVKYPASPSGRDEKHQPYGEEVRSDEEKKKEFVDFIAKLPPEALRPHYPTMGDLIVSALEKGEQLPFGLEAKGIAGTLPKLRLTSKKEL